MIILLAILAATRAYPVGLQSPPVLARDQLQSPSCNDLYNCRSLWDIIRSCAVTIFLCTWVSVHPNIPGPDEGWPRVTIRRVGLMLATLVVPEAIIAWALRQRLAAGKLAEKYKGEGWTLTHGFFATMGGFMEYEGNRPIRDKSKGDFISKAVVILQTSWFVMQCIARGVRGLPITELELATIAFAGLNFAIYVLWWDKPLNVQCGVRVYRQRITDPPVDDGYVIPTDGFWAALGSALSKLPAAIVHGPSKKDNDGPWLYRVLVWPVAKPIEIMAGGDEDRVGNRIYTFYPRKWNEDQTIGWAFIILIAGIASAFGGIHCIGWSFTFPSGTERTLWRVASISITSIPIAGFLYIFVVESDSLVDFRDWVDDYVPEAIKLLIALLFIPPLYFFTYLVDWCC
ncbi:hypothetical protein BC827DRAFT_1274197 [Russula dissimulans]|nr:hypothetical protein BC827DRAFT_1274197 [Russula dissimulans]